MAVLKDLIVHGRSRFINGIDADKIEANAIKADSGVFNQLIATTLEAKNASIDELTAQNATVFGVMDVKGKLQTNQWEAASIANIGGNFYISPTGKSSSGTVTITRTSAASGSTAAKYSVTMSGTFGVGTTSGTIWVNGAYGMATGNVSVGTKKYPLGTCDGPLSNIGIGTNTITAFTISNIESAALDIIFDENTSLISSNAISSKPGTDLQVSVYLGKSGSNYMPVGILLTSYGKDNKQYIDIYDGGHSAGTSITGFADPVARIGDLSGLNPYTQANKYTITPSGWGIYTSNGYFKGEVYAEQGYIGGFTIGSTDIHNGKTSRTETTNNGVWVGTDGIGFGKGVTYFSLDGTGKIGPWTLTTTALYNSKSSYNASVSGGGVYIGTDYIAGGNGEVWWLKKDGSAKIGAMELTSAGVLSVPAANITNLSTAAVTAVTGSFSMLKSGVITTKANRTTYDAVTAGLTLDMNGIGAGNGTACTFKVEQNTGILTATGANITGSITATSFVAQASNKKRAEVTTDGLLIYDTSGSTLVASFGADEAIIGKAQRSRLEMDSTTLQLIDRNNKVYFVAKDLRDPSTGQFSTFNIFEGTGSATTFTLSHIANSTTYPVTVNGTTITSGITKTTTSFTFNTAPANGAEIKATYTTVTDDAKYYTLGFRNADIRNGASSCGFGYGISAAGMYSIAEGLESSAMGRISHAEGYQTLAYSTASHAEGNNTKTYGSASHAEGYSTTASGDTSHAEGNASSASGNISHAEGYNTKAIGAVSHAEGNETQATAAYSHAQNNSTIAAGNCQTAIGQFNKSMASGVYLVIGNGTSDARHNALTVDSAGWITANEHSSPMGYVNGNSGSASISTGNSPVKLSANISLTAGTYILIGEASFAANATGVRHLAWSSSEGGTRLVTRVTRNASSGGFATRIQVSDIWNIDEGATRTLYLECYQNSGATLAVDYYWQYVRIY